MNGGADLEDALLLDDIEGETTPKRPAHKREERRATVAAWIGVAVLFTIAGQAALGVVVLVVWGVLALRKRAQARYNQR